MTVFRKNILALAVLAGIYGTAHADVTYGFSVRMSGTPSSTESYAFAYPEFTFTNNSSPGIGITSISMDDGSATQLWDTVSLESASNGIGYTLTQGDRVNNSGWHSTIAYNFTGFDSNKKFGFYVDPDTLRYGTGNVVDARPYVFAGGKATVTFSNDLSITLTWSNPIAYSFDPLRVGQNPTDLRNIYYEMSGSEQVTNDVPEPQTFALMLAALGVMGAVAHRRKAKQTA